MSDKPRIGIFDFACCEGCQLTIVSLGEPLVELLQHVEVVTWREAISEHSEEFDIAIVEGSISRDSDVPRLQRIREQAKVLIALGACATLGGVQVQDNRFAAEELLELVYGEAASRYEAGEVRPVSAVVPVDVPIHGCPINPDEFVAVVQHLLLGKPYRVSPKPVCYECKLNAYECVYDRGQLCLGPVTRCGCNAICVSRGHRCFGCRGLVDEVNVNAAKDVLTEHGLRLEDVLGMFEIYSLRAEPARTLAESERKKARRAEPWRFGSTTSLG